MDRVTILTDQSDRAKRAYRAHLDTADEDILPVRAEAFWKAPRISKNG